MHRVGSGSRRRGRRAAPRGRGSSQDARTARRGGRGGLVHPSPARSSRPRDGLREALEVPCAPRRPLPRPAGGGEASPRAAPGRGARCAPAPGCPCCPSRRRVGGGAGSGGVECRSPRTDGRTDARGGGARGARGAGGPAGQSPRASACLRAFSRRSAILEFLLLLFAAAATTAAAEADSASEAMGSPKGGGGNIK